MTKANETQPSTLVHRIAHWAEVQPNAPALYGKEDGVWKSLSWGQYWENVRAIARALISLGHQPGESLAILGANHPQWVQLQFGAQAARGVPAPIYATNTVEQAAYIVADSGARFCAVDSREQLDKLLEGEKQGLFARIEHYITFSSIDTVGLDEDVKGRLSSFAEFLERSAEDKHDAELEERLADLRPDETCILIYTSGTTGQPKGVEIDHKGQLLIGDAVFVFAPELVAGTVEYRALSYLPLSHQAEQLLTNVITLMVGGEAYFCPDLYSVRDYLAEVRPTVFLGVPRVWEKFEAALKARLSQAEGAKGKLARWALRTELAAFDEQVKRGVAPEAYMPVTRKLARKLIVDKIKAALGLDRLVVALTGSAPMAPSTQRFFASLGITIYDVYGLTETSGAATITDRLRPSFGTVGKPFHGVELRIADDGEIQFHGENSVKGYRGLPDESAALFTDDGWLKTGDIGTVDGDGNLRITGRIKELIITAGAKNVAPVELENYIKTIPGIGPVVVIGDRRPYLVAVVGPDPENLEVLAAAAGASSEHSLAALANDPKVHDYFQREIESRCNSKVARYQTIKKIAVLDQPFTIEGGELTANMKIRRKAVEEKYAAKVEELYAGGTLNTPEANAG